MKYPFNTDGLEDLSAWLILSVVIGVGAGIAFRVFFWITGLAH